METLIVAAGYSCFFLAGVSLGSDCIIRYVILVAIGAVCVGMV